jgi:hypothetical protein
MKGTKVYRRLWVKGNRTEHSSFFIKENGDIISQDNRLNEDIEEDPDSEYSCKEDDWSCLHEWRLACQ